jgi:hypothetical protein
MRNFVYPIRETVEESWERLLKIYDITDKLVGSDCLVPVSTCDIMQAWCDMAMFLANAVELLRGVDYMYEAIYHIRYRVFSENVSEQNELKLVLLVEDELCRCGYAFHVWSNMSEFQSVYQELLFPHKKGRGWRSFCPWYMEMYLAGNMANRIMLKDIRPIDWGEKLNCDRATFPYGPDYMRYRITVYERAMELLFPESEKWYEEWTDELYIVERIRDCYKMDFTNDKVGYDNLIGLIVERKCSKRCFKYLYDLNGATTELLEVLWREKTPEMLKRCFLELFSRYKAAKKNTKRSRYSREAVMHNWLYQWIEENCTVSNDMLSRKVRKAMLQIAMNF